MVVNLCKWASRHRKIAKSGHRVAAETIPFRRRWHGCMISVNLEAIWGMSVNTEAKMPLKIFYSSLLVFPHRPDVFKTLRKVLDFVFA